MMNAPAAVTSYVNANNVSTRVDLYTLTLLDGTVYRWTTCDMDVPYGGNTWLSNGAVLGRGNLRKTARLEVDSLDVILGGEVLIGGVTIAKLAVQRKFYGARLQIDHMVGSNLANAIANGPVKAYFEGRVSDVEPGPLEVRMMVKSDLEGLNQKLPRFFYQLACMNAVYDSVCTLVKSTFTLTGTASGSPTTTTVPTATAAITAKAANWFNLGVITFTGGANNGLRRAIKSWDGTTFTLALPLPAAPAAGDTFSVYPGCPHTQAACAAFPNAVGATDNTGNFRGFPHLPAPEGAL